MTTTTIDRKPLTERQREILRWLSAYIAEHGFSPTVRELCLAFKFDSPNGAICHLVPLRNKGWIEWHDGKARTIRVLEEAAK
jgi:repressor LexA